MKPWHGIFFGIGVTFLSNALGIYNNPGGETFAFFLPGIIFWSVIAALIIKQINKG